MVIEQFNNILLHQIEYYIIEVIKVFLSDGGAGVFIGDDKWSRGGL